MSALRALEEVGGPVLAICAHPDDIEIHAGGLAARLVQEGQEVEFVLVTSGDRGTADPSQTREQVAAIREEEQRRAASALGIERITFLRFPDGDVQFELRALREQVIRLIREKRPRTIVTHDPFWRGDNGDPCSVYPDHRAVGATVFEAAYVAAPAPLYHPEMLTAETRPHKPDRLLCVMSDRPTFFVDIGTTFPEKWSAISQHRSQGRALPEMESFFRRIAAEQGALAGCELAEGYWELLPG